MNRSLSRIRLLIAWSLLPAAFSFAQPQVKRQVLSARDGMSHRWPMSAEQDSYGFLWIGTYDGLNRYDGQRFTVYRHDPQNPNSLINSTVAWISAGPDGRIWCSTQGGISVYDPKQDRFTNYRLGDSFTDSTALFSPNLRCLGSGKVIVTYSAREGGDRLHVYHPDGTQTTFPHAFPPALKIIEEMEDGDRVLLLSNKGYAIADLEKETYTPLGDMPPGLEKAGTPFPFDTQGRFWYWHKDRFMNAPFPVAGAWRSRLMVDNRGNLRIYHYPTSSIFLLDKEEGFFKWIAREEEVHYTTSDNYGATWICSQQGLIRIVTGNEAFSRVLNSPLILDETPPISFSCYDLFELPDGPVIAADHDFSARIIPEEHARKYPELSSVLEQNAIFPIAEARNGILWFCEKKGSTASNLVAYDPLRHTMTRFPLPGTLPLIRGRSSWMWEDEAGRIWIASESGIGYYDPAAGRFYETKDRLASPLCAFFHPEEQIFYSIGLNTLRAFDCRQEKMVWHEALTFTSANEISQHHALIWHEGFLWVGSTRGLARLDTHTKKWDVFTRAQGLSDNLIYSIQPDGRYLWLGTGNGLCRFDIHTHETLSFFTEDGLSHNEFNRRATLKARDGKIWMGGLNGINIFDPRQFDDFKPQKPNIRLSSCFWSDEEGKKAEVTPFTPYFVVQPGYANINFRFFLDNFIQPSDHKFSFFLEGLDNTWSSWAPEPGITYHHLSPGRYTLRAKGMDDRGIVSENEAMIRFRVLEVWWLRPWALSLYAVAALALGFALFRFELRRRLERSENKRLKELDTLKNRLYANITHEFRTPLTLILGPAERLLKKEDVQQDADTFKNLQSVKNSAYRLLALVNQILDLRKIENKSMQVHYRQGDIIMALRMLMESFHSMAFEKAIATGFESNTVSFHTSYDRDKLLKIAGNLLANAFKFTPEGGSVHMSVHIDPLHTPENVVIHVTDTGIGIAEGEQSRIFERFYQADNRHSRSGEGTGIGLTLVQELVTLLGGNIQVHSKPGQGASFTVRLPVVAPQGEHDTIIMDPASDMSAMTGALIPKAETNGVSPGAFAVLVVEDNEDIARYIGACLADTCRVTYAPNGGEGVLKALELSPDLVITDLMMPVKDGLELTETLKNDERSSHIPIIMLTARAEIQDRIEGLRRGADAYLSKPFNEEELRITAARLIQLREVLRKRYAHTPVVSLDSSTPELAYEDAFFMKTMAFFHENLTRSDLKMEELYRHLLMSHTQVHRKLLAISGKTPLQMLRDMRLEKARTLLTTTRLNVNEIAWACGFDDPSYFARIFTRETGATPSAFRG